MNSDGWFVLVLLLINLLIVLVYLIPRLFLRKRVRSILIAAFMLIFPILGAAFLAIAETWRNVVLHNRSRSVDKEDLSFSQERVRLITAADRRKGLDLVPIEESLRVAGRKEKRSSFIDILKGDDFEENFSTIQSAVEDEDLEVSHYAASFVTSIVAQYKQKEQRLRAKAEEEASPENLAAYINYMVDILRRNPFSPVELKLYMETLDRMTGELYEQQPDAVEDATILVLVDNWNRLNMPERVGPWINLAQSRIRSSLDCVKICARYYYGRGDTQAMAGLMREVRSSSLILDSEVLEWVRFFRLA